MWLKSGADHLKIPESVQEIKRVIVRRKGMSYPLFRTVKESYVSEKDGKPGVPVMFCFDKENHRILLHPRSDRRYSVMVFALVEKLL